MNRTARHILIPTTAFALIGLAVVWPILFETFGFEPAAACFNYDRGILLFRSVGDILLFGAYQMIGGWMTYFVLKYNRGKPYWWINLLFIGFIVLCGWVYFANLITLYEPFYWLQTFLIVVTSLVSIATAVILWLLTPRLQVLAQAALESETQHQRNEVMLKAMRALYKQARVKGMRIELPDDLPLDIRRKMEVL